MAERAAPLASVFRDAITGPRFFSQSGGNDSNNGLTELTPWKSLAKVSQYICLPGAQLLFKRGDTWTNESLVLVASNGIYKGYVFDNVFASTFATQNAAYLGGATMPGGLTFSGYQTLRVNAGASAPVAAADATEYCRRKAIIDAEIAGRNAAQAATNWMIVGSYGSGARPIFDGTGVTPVGVDFGTGVAPSGWKISDVEVKNYIGSGIFYNAASGVARGTWVTNCSAHDNQNPTGTPVYGGSTFGTSRTMGCGISLPTIVNLFMDNCTCDNNDVPWLVGFANDCIVDTCSATHSRYLAAYMTTGTRLWEMNCTLDTLCNGPGLPTGTAAVTFGSTLDSGFSVCAHNRTQKNNGADAEAFDSEGVNNNNVSIFSCVADSNGGAAILNSQFGGPSSGTMVDNTTFNKNGILFASNTNVTLMRTPNGVNNDRIIFTRCSVVKPVNPPDPATQSFMFAAVHNTGPTDTITDWFPNGVFGPDNTVT